MNSGAVNVGRSAPPAGERDAGLAIVARDESARIGAAEDALRRLLDDDATDPAQALETAERVRSAHIGGIEAVLARFEARTGPLSGAPFDQFVLSIASLRLGHELNAHLFERLGARAAAADDATGVGPPVSIQQALALARAIDYQSRVVSWLQRLGFVVEPADWDALCVLALRLRSSTYLDTEFPDDVAQTAATTPRASFVYPLLAWVAMPQARTRAQFALVIRLAKRWAGKVGFRIERNVAPHNGRHGPWVALTESHAVRLVTGRLQRRLEDRSHELATLGPQASARLPRGLTPESTRKLLEELDSLWLAPRTVLRFSGERLGTMNLRFGFPKAPSSSGNRYSSIYGRFEQNTVVRLSLGAGSTHDPLAGWVAGAQSADWIGIDRGCSTFECTLPAERVEIGAMVTAIASSIAPRAPGALPATGGRRMFGRVASIAQRLVASESPVHRIEVELWPGDPVGVGLRVGNDGTIHDGFLLSPDPATGKAATLVLPAGHFRAATRATLRHQMREIEIRLDQLLDRGDGYDRCSFTPIPG